jgi:transcriptional regulator with XRE-family HTH domain
MKTTKELLGARIKEIRKASGLSQEKLAEKIRIEPKHLSRLEVGRSYPSMKTLENMALAMGVEIRDFFEFEHHMGDKEVTTSLKKLLKEADTPMLRLLLKIVRAVVR